MISRLASRAAIRAPPFRSAVPRSFGAMSDAEYEERVSKFGLSTRAETKAAAALPNAVWVDVRSDGEVQDTPLGAAFVHIPVTMTDVSQIAAQAAAKLPDKAAPLLVFCGVGGRAMGAKKSLEALGYTQVLNVGGLKDIAGLV